MATKDGNPLVTVATYGVTGGSARVRIHDWLHFLDIEAVHHDYLGGGENGLRSIIRGLPRLVHAELNLRRLAREVKTSTLLLSREASPFSNGGLESSLLTGASRSIYDFDDAIFDTHARGPRKLWNKAKVWSAAITAADVVIAGNEYLAEHAAKLRADVVIIPSCVNPPDYVPKSDYALAEVPTLVWMGSPATEPYLQQITEPLLAVHSERSIRLLVVSAGSRSLGELDKIVERVAWSPQSFGSVLAQADIGIMPLDDSLYARGKCAYKLLQYGASGLPTVGSPVGANRGVLEAMGGRYATTKQDWEQALLDLIASEDADRSALGKHARDVISEKYSFDHWAGVWRSSTGI
ncbi:glycosyltransferase [Arthrobacter sp. SAFR-044]|uniref:glycosyltransferase n=1 Tax=Arthrobacter sp. SAFR-044 TaxID=3387278 RepID=UPI003F7C1599